MKDNSQTTILPPREPDGEFHSFQTWVCKAASWIGGTNPLCADAQGRICRNGGDFMRAEKENAFPIRFWYGEGGQTFKEQRKAKVNHKAAMRLMYPWAQYQAYMKTHNGSNEGFVYQEVGDMPSDWTP